MKRIFAPIESVRAALHSQGIESDRANWIVDLFECVDVGKYEALALPNFNFNLYSTLTSEEVLITVFSFWHSVAVFSENDSSQKQIAFGAIRSVYFMAQGFGLTKFVGFLEIWWEQNTENSVIWMVA